MKMDIRPVATEADYDWALAEIEPYFIDEPKPGTVASARFEVLTTLIEAYELKHWPIKPPTAVDAIIFRMEQGGFTQADLGRILGSRSRASEILSHRRSLTMEQVRRLHQEWNIPLEALIQTGEAVPA